MLPILNAKQSKQIDQYTIENKPIASIDLMERASTEFVKWYTQRFDTRFKITIISGTGNNGGDGLAIARLLRLSSYEVSIYVVTGGEPSPDFLKNLQRAKKIINVVEISEPGSTAIIAESEVVIDALLGYGLSRPLQGLYASVVECVNKRPGVKIAVDIPSGLMTDKPSFGVIFEADFTVTFQLPKLAFFFPENYKYVGEWYTVNIDLCEDFFQQVEPHHFLVTEESIQKIFKPRHKFDHKGTYGHGLLVAGSLGKMGSATLSARAATKSGLGLLTIHTPTVGLNTLQIAVPEAMVSCDVDQNYFSTLPSLITHFAAVAVGPGISKNKTTTQALHKLLIAFQKPLIIDADALNILAEDRQLMSLIIPESILTPHVKEFERLVGVWHNDFERLEKQRALSMQLRSIIILKGAFSSISFPNGNVYFNPTGNPGMATGGSGDVLTGILLGLLTQGYSPTQTAILGTYLHGLAGDLAVEELGIHSLVASDLVAYLSKAFLKLKQK